MKLTFLDKIAKREDYKQRYPKKSYGEIEVKIFLDENHIEYEEEVSGTIINYDTGETLNVRIDYYIPKCYKGSRNKNYTENEINDIIERNKDMIIDFYERFIKYMQNMIIKGKEKGYSLISFMGP